ncbi:MAG: hypothetical protein ABJD11_14310 [Gemmatimonadota bacterium]
MRIAHRMFLALLPAVLGLFTVSGLAYWGRFERQVPGSLLLVAAIATVASLVIAWRNTRHVAQRIERLAEDDHAAGESEAPGVRKTGASSDELEALERVVGQVSAAEQETRERERAAAARVGEYAELLAEVSAAASAQLTQLRLPLHILLENHFGALNENQEEMLAAAQTGADQLEVELRRLREIAEIDQGALEIRRDLVHPGDLVLSLMPTLRSLGERTEVRVRADIEPGLPRLLGDWTRLQEALSLLLSDRVRYAPSGEEVAIGVTAEPGVVRVAVDRGAAHAATADLLLARRLIGAHGGEIEEGSTRTVVTLPARHVPSGFRASGKTPSDNKTDEG